MMSRGIQHIFREASKILKIIKYWFKLSKCFGHKQILFMTARAAFRAFVLV